MYILWKPWKENTMTTELLIQMTWNFNYAVKVINIFYKKNKGKKRWHFICSKVTSLAYAWHASFGSKKWITHTSRSLFYRYPCSDCVTDVEKSRHHIENLLCYLRSFVRILNSIFLFRSISANMFAVSFFN